jgi:hypothetical protein
MEVAKLSLKKLTKSLSSSSMATATLDSAVELLMVMLNGKLVSEALPLILQQRDIKSLSFTLLHGGTRIPT